MDSASEAVGRVCLRELQGRGDLGRFNLEASERARANLEGSVWDLRIRRFDDVLLK